MDERERALENIIIDLNEQKALVEDRIKSEVEYSHEDQIKIFESGLNKEIDTYLEKELNDLKLFVATQKSQARLKNKNELLNRRKHLVDDLFNEVIEEVKKFVSSDLYRDYLIKNIKKISEISAEGFFQVRENDLEIFKKILVELSIKNKVVAFKYELGGFSYIDETRSIEVDCTLDGKLLDEKKWFQNNSGLTL